MSPGLSNSVEFSLQTPAPGGYHQKLIWGLACFRGLTLGHGPCSPDLWGEKEVLRRCTVASLDAQHPALLDLWWVFVPLVSFTWSYPISLGCAAQPSVNISRSWTRPSLYFLFPWGSTLQVPATWTAWNSGVCTSAQQDCCAVVRHQPAKPPSGHPCLGRELWRLYNPPSWRLWPCTASGPALESCSLVFCPTSWLVWCC